MNRSVPLVHSTALRNIPSTNTQWLAQLVQPLSPLPGQGHQQNNNTEQRNFTQHKRRLDSADQQYTAHLVVALCWFFSFGSYCATKLRCCRWYSTLQLPKPKHQTSTRQLIAIGTWHINPTIQYQNASSLVESWSVLVSSCQPSAIHNSVGNSELHPP